MTRLTWNIWIRWLAIVYMAATVMFQASTKQTSAITATLLNLSKVAQFAPPRVAQFAPPEVAQVSPHFSFFTLRNKSYDLSYTYDNRPIVSLRFKEFCLRDSYQHLDFVEFEHEPNFFHLKIDQTVKVNFEKSVRSTNHFCELCKTWGGVYLNELILDLPVGLGGGIYKTDIPFSGGNQKSPILVVGNETFHKLKREKMKGIICLPINS